MAQKGRDERALREALTSVGLRVTSARTAILRELAKLERPISHTELADRMRGSTVDRATIYRNLVGLTDVGLLVRTQLGDQVWRYELPRQHESAGHDAHPHLLCNDCGVVKCLASGSVTLHGEAASATISEVQLRGVCAACSS